MESHVLRHLPGSKVINCCFSNDLNMFHMPRFIFILVFTFSLSSLTAQEEFKRHSISLVMANSHVPSGIDIEGKSKWLILTSWGLDYDYRFSEKWLLSIQSDLILENFQVEAFASNPKDVLDRAYPLSLVLAGIFEPIEPLGIVFGMGYEFAPEENLLLLRGGLEHCWTIDEKWGVFINLLFDYKPEAYDSWSFGAGVKRHL